MELVPAVGDKRSEQQGVKKTEITRHCHSIKTAFLQLFCGSNTDFDQFDEVMVKKRKMLFSKKFVQVCSIYLFTENTHHTYITHNEKYKNKNKF